jgi:hypothetical protein
MKREPVARRALGLILGVLDFLRTAVWSMFSNLDGPHWPLVVATLVFAPGRMINFGVAYVFMRGVLL